MRFIPLIFIMIAFSACSHKTPKKQSLTNPTQEAYKERIKREWMEKKATTTLERELENRRLKATTGIDMEEHSPLDEVLDAVFNTP